MPAEKVDTVVVTGFGPFGDFKVNSSWEAVKALMEMPEVGSLPVKLVAEQIKVSYEKVAELIPQLHQQVNPVLMVHVGVSPFAKCITLEKCANKAGYCRNDVDGKLPESNQCAIGSNSCMNSALDLEAIVQDFNQKEAGVTAMVSKDAGRYLCEFTYYTSLNLTNARSIFVHVPDLDHPYSAQQSARGLYEVIRLALKQIRTDCPIENNSIDCVDQTASAL